MSNFPIDRVSEAGNVAAVHEAQRPTALAYETKGSGGRARFWMRCGVLLLLIAGAVVTSALRLFQPMSDVKLWVWGNDFIDAAPLLQPGQSTPVPGLIQNPNLFFFEIANSRIGFRHGSGDLLPYDKVTPIARPVYARSLVYTKPVSRTKTWPLTVMTYERRDMYFANQTYLGVWIDNAFFAILLTILALWRAWALWRRGSRDRGAPAT